MRRLTCIALVCALAGCDIDIDVGDDRRDGEGAPVPAPICPARAELAAYRVTLDPTSVFQASCWVAGVPSDTKLAAETFEVLIVQRGTLGVTGLSPQKLGDAPVITVGAAFAGDQKEFEWRSESMSGGALVKTRAIFRFDRVDTRETTGTLTLDASSDPGVACQLVRTFQATAVDPNAAWTITTPLLGNASRYVAVLDLGALSRNELSCSASDASTRVFTPTLRAIEVWQIAWPLARVPPRSIALPGAPVVDVESDFGPIPQQHETETDAGVDARETRSTKAELILPCTSGADAGLTLTSRYECTGAGCAALSPEDSGECSVNIPYSVFAL